MWILRRRKQNIFELELSLTKTSVIESYTLLILTDDEAYKIQTMGSWIWDNGIRRCKAIAGEPVNKYFISIAYKRFKESKLYDFSEVIESNVPGTSRLVRSRDKTRIYIARRKGNVSYNQTRINSVCIDDHTRELFFADVREENGNNPFCGKYELTVDDLSFAYWNKFMDKEYLEQTGQLK